MRYLSQIFWRLSWYVCIQDTNNSEFLVCLSVCWLAYFLTEIGLIWGYLQFWMRYLSEIFWRHSQDISGLFPNYFEFLVCLSVCLLAYFLTEIGLICGYLQFWRRYLSEIFWRHSQDIFGLFQNYFEFFCMSVSLFVGLLSN